jgi:Tol biopolymer transport system component
MAGNRTDLMLVKTSGQATPTRLRENVDNGLPQWSPTGEWITFADNQGWHLLSPDGKTIRGLGAINPAHLAFSLDGKKLYGIRRDGEHYYLISVDVASGKDIRNIADIGKDYAPASSLNPGVRLSVAPDGTCAIYTIATTKSSIWLFEGFAGP